jgi:hypothetical protein
LPMTRSLCLSVPLALHVTSTVNLEYVW